MDSFEIPIEKAPLDWRFAVTALKARAANQIDVLFTLRAAAMLRANGHMDAPTDPSVPAPVCTLTDLKISFSGPASVDIEPLSQLDADGGTWRLPDLGCRDELNFAVRFSVPAESLPDPELGGVVVLARGKVVVSITSLDGAEVSTQMLRMRVALPILWEDEWMSTARDEEVAGLIERVRGRPATPERMVDSAGP